MAYIKFFTDISLDDAPLVGPKNASLGEMIQTLQTMGIKVPLGFAVTVKGYQAHIEKNNLVEKMEAILKSMQSEIASMQEAGKQLRDQIYNAPLPEEVVKEITEAYNT